MLLHQHKSADHGDRKVSKIQMGNANDLGRVASSSCSFLLRLIALNWIAGKGSEESDQHPLGPATNGAAPGSSAATNGSAPGGGGGGGSSNASGTGHDVDMQDMGGGSGGPERRKASMYVKNNARLQKGAR